MILSVTPDYDPDAPEGAKSPGSQYVGKKDFVIVAIILVAAILLSIPIFKSMNEETHKSVCKKNMNALAKALEQYAVVNDGRFPPLFETGGAGSPSLAEGGIPVAWASVISSLGTGAGFSCPSATAEENVKVNGDSIRSEMGNFKQTKLNYRELSYGMLADLATRPSTDISDPSAAILLGETSNYGAKGVLNPVPYTDENDKDVPFDGFVIGYDDSNYAPTSSTKRVTRLAFYDDAHGGGCRHKDKIHVIYADGRLGSISRSSTYYDKAQLTWRAR